MWDRVAFVGLAVVGVVGVAVGLTYLLLEGAKKGWEHDDKEKNAENDKKRAGQDPPLKVEGPSVVTLPGPGFGREPAADPQAEPVRPDAVADQGETA
jgi:hypothetical protein